MVAEQIAEFQACFEIVEEPRVAGRCDHPLDSVLFLIVAAAISGADGPVEIEDFGKNRQDWLKQFVDLPAGIPSHDTIGRLLSLLKPDAFQEALILWMEKLREIERSEDSPVIVPIDGKTARGSYTTAGKSNALHIVSAWATEHGLTLGPVAVDSKSNEITAIPQLLTRMDLRNTIISMDALGCQKAIAKQIVDNGGDYTFAVKENHPNLYKAIVEVLEEAYEVGLVESGYRYSRNEQKGHGRNEVRHYIVAAIPAPLRSIAKTWPGIKSIGQAINVTTKDGRETCETRYYISSRPAKVSEFSRSVRKHWGIESMHWILDVVFGEDASRIRTGYATENMSFVRRFVTSLLKQDTSRSSLKGKRKIAGWNTDFLERLMFG